MVKYVSYYYEWVYIIWVPFLSWSRNKNSWYNLIVLAPLNQLNSIGGDNISFSSALLLEISSRKGGEVNWMERESILMSIREYLDQTFLLSIINPP